MLKHKVNKNSRFFKSPSQSEFKKTSYEEKISSSKKTNKGKQRSQSVTFKEPPVFRRHHSFGGFDVDDDGDDFFDGSFEKEIEKMKNEFR